LFIFINLLHKTLDKFLLRKYYKEKTSIVPYFGAPHKQKKKEKIQKIKKCWKYIYIIKKSILECPRNRWKLVEANQIYQIEKFNSVFFD
jgi:hypothetical protein